VIANTQITTLYGRNSRPKEEEKPFLTRNVKMGTKRNYMVTTGPTKKKSHPQTGVRRKWSSKTQRKRAPKIEIKEEEKPFLIRNVKSPSFTPTSENSESPFTKIQENRKCPSPPKYTKQEIHGYNGVEIEFSPHLTRCFIMLSQGYSPEYPASYPIPSFPS